MAKSVEKIIINFTKEISVPKDFNELAQLFCDCYEQKFKNNFIFYYKDKEDKYTEINENTNIKDIINKNINMIFVKEEQNLGSNIKINLQNNNFDVDFSLNKSIENLNTIIKSKIKKNNNENFQKEYEKLVNELQVISNNLEQVKNINKLEIDKRLNLENENEKLKNENEELIKKYEKKIKELKKNKNIIIKKNKNEKNE